MLTNRLQSQDSAKRLGVESFRLTDITTYGRVLSITGGSRPPSGQSPGSAPTARHGRMISHPDVNLNGPAKRPARNFV
jgi:hypothetical protein